MAHGWYELHPPHLINVAALPFENQNTKRVILPKKIASFRCIIASSKSTRSSCALNLLIWGVMQQCVYETKIHDIDDLQKHLMHTWFDFDRDIINAAIEPVAYHMRSCVPAGVDTLNTC